MERPLIRTGVLSEGTGVRPTRHLPALLGVAVLLATSAPVAGCGGSDGGDEDSAGGAPAESTDRVTIDDFEFMPAELTVQAGAEITVTNDDTAAHTLSADDGGDFDTGGIEADGDEGAFTIEEEGTYPFICEFHPTMKGTVTAAE
jgi:plastocyanin